MEFYPTPKRNEIMQYIQKWIGLGNRIFYIFSCVSVWVYMHEFRCPQETEESDPRGWVYSSCEHQMWVLGTALRFTTRLIAAESPCQPQEILGVVVQAQNGTIYHVIALLRGS